MAEYQRKVGDFVLFPNDRKREGKQDPDYNGTFYGKDGKEFWFNGWIKANGVISGNVGKEKLPQGAAQRAGPPPPSRAPAGPPRGPAPQRQPQPAKVVQTDFGTVEGEVVEDSPF
jgi:hypothetical protein